MSKQSYEKKVGCFMKIEKLLISNIISEEMSTSEETIMKLWESKNNNMNMVTLKKVANLIKCEYNSKIKKNDIITKLTSELSEKIKDDTWLTDEINQNLITLFNIKSGVRASNNEQKSNNGKVPKKNTRKQEPEPVSESDSDSETNEESIVEFTITNREDLKDKIHEIHNYLRNGGVAFGMGALKIFNLLYGLARIERYNMMEKIELDSDCKFSTLSELSGQSLLDKVYDISEKIQDKSDINIYKCIICTIPENIKCSILENLIKDITILLDSEERLNEQLSGKIYEYFIGRDKSAISDLGAYFTNRHIVEYIYNLVNPTIKSNGAVGTMIDPFGGSGGFTLGFVEYMNKTHTIDWSENVNNIYHVDMNPDVVKYAGMEIMCLTQEIPNMNDNIKCENSFSYEFDKKFDYVFTNPPYGGDKDNNKVIDEKTKRLIAFLTTKYEEYISSDTPDKLKSNKYLSQIKNCKLKQKQDIKRKENQKVSVNNSSKFIQKYCEDNKLNKQSYKDKESTSLILTMALLEVGGTGVGVLKEGVFFDSKYSSLRKHLVENFNVTDIVSIPQNQFENTSTKTSIIVFHNTKEKTTEIDFRKIDVVAYDDDVFEEENGEWKIKYMKNDIKELSETKVSNATVEDLKKTNYDFYGKKYNIKELKPNKGFKIVKLGDIIKFLPKSKRKASYGNNTGKIPFYTSSDKIKCCDDADYKDESLIIGTGGNSSLHYINDKFSCSGDNLIISSKNTKYIYYIVKSMWDLLINEMNGSTIRHVTNGLLTNFKIPIPNDNKVMQMWVDRISTPYNEKLEKQELLKLKEQEVQTEIKRITEYEECEEKKLGETKEFVYIPDKLNIPLSEGLRVGTYPFYSNSESKKLFVNRCSFKELYIIVGMVGNMSIHIDKMFSILNREVYVINCININNYYVFWQLILLKQSLLSKRHTSTIPRINKQIFNEFVIKIPKDKSLIENMEPLFQEIEQLKQDIELADKLFEQEIKNLKKASIKD